MERSKKKVQLWQKAMVHFALCFVMGFFSGFAPTGKSSVFSGRSMLSTKSDFSPQPAVVSLPDVNRTFSAAETVVSERTELLSEDETPVKETEQEGELEPRRLIILVTPTSSRDKFRGVWLRRLANTVSLLPQPVLWIVVEAQTESEEVSEMLRRTGVMYRHLVLKENVTEEAAEMEQQRNLALRHIEHHRLSGVVHFAGLSNVYDLDFFDELREIEVFGTWPMAILSPNRSRVIIEGPVCDSSQVLGWHLKKMNNETDSKPPIHISGFAFNSSILWDPERWGRPSADQDVSQQNSIKFVKQVVLEDEAKVKGMPPEDCSRILLWHLKTPMGSSSPLSHYLPAAATTSAEDN